MSELNTTISDSNGNQLAQVERESIGKRLKKYFDETYNELFHKVSWPTWSELQSSAIVVMIASVIISIIVFLMDFGFNKIMDTVYHLF